MLRTFEGHVRLPSRIRSEAAGPFNKEGPLTSVSRRGSFTLPVPLSHRAARRLKGLSVYEVGSIHTLRHRTAWTAPNSPAQTL